MAPKILDKERNGISSKKLLKTFLKWLSIAFSFAGNDQTIRKKIKKTEEISDPYYEDLYKKFYRKSSFFYYIILGLLSFETVFGSSSAN